jgi:SAM-dependent methyltransferase
MWASFALLAIACGGVPSMGLVIPVAAIPQRPRPAIQRLAANVLPFANARVLTEPDPDIACVLCDSEAKAFSALRSHGLGRVEGKFSVDLGKRQVDGFTVSEDGVLFPDSAEGTGGDPPPADLTWDDLAHIGKKGGAWRCYWGASGYEPSKVDGFSELTGRAASLYPVEGSPPTVVLGGFGMHRFAGSASPAMDTKLKLRALGHKLRGRVLDVCTGLGYTAIGAAEKEAVEIVATLELDPLMVRIQDANPWSAGLWGPKVERYLGDAVDLLPHIPAGSFDAICHDPPAQAMSGELFSQEVYAHFARILTPSGALYHYIGDPDSRASGKLFR